MLFCGRHGNTLLNGHRNRGDSLQNIRSRVGQASSEAAELLQTRGRGSIPPWTPTDGCRRAERINSTGDPRLHHLNLFLEAPHPTFFFSHPLSSLSKSYLKFTAFPPVFLVVVSLLSWFWFAVVHVNHADAKYAQAAAALQRWTIRGELRVCRFSFQTESSRCFHWSLPPLWLSASISEIYCNLWLEGNSAPARSIPAAWIPVIL